MGITRVNLKICHPERRDLCETIENVIVDTGSLNTWIPREILDKLAIRPLTRKHFRFMNGATEERDIAPAICEINGEKGSCQVVFALANDGIVLGAEALENMGLKVDPRTGKLEKSALLAL